MPNVPTPSMTVNGGPVSAGSLPAQAANTYLANNTAATAQPTAVAMPFILDPNVTNSIKAWSSDPLNSVAGGNLTPAAATIYLVKIPIPVSITATNILVGQATAGTSYTNAQLGLYDSSGTFLSASVVQASAGPNGFNSGGGIVTLPLAAAQSLTGSPTAFVWAAFHAGTNGATAIVLRAGANGSNYMINAGTSTSTLRSASYTGHATNPLATIGNLTPTSMSSASSTIWAGLS